MADNVIRVRDGLLLIATFLLAIAGTAAAQDVPVARADVFSAPVDSLLSVAPPGVLENDSSSTVLRALLIEGPSHGDLVLHPNGSFTYKPRSGFTGVDQFIYVAQHDSPLIFDIDEEASEAQLSARVSTTIGTESDRDASRLDGFAEARLYPDAEPFTQLQITSLELRLIDGIHLNFDFGFLAGELDVHGAPDSVQLRLDEPGEAAAVNDGEFVQRGNRLLLDGRLDVEANRVIGTLIDDGPQTLDIRTPADLSGSVNEVNSEVVLSVPLDIEGTFEVAGNDIDVAIAGSVRASTTPTPRISSNEAVVTLVVGTVATKTETLPATSDLRYLVRNYPNPFSGSTRIIFRLPEPGEITLTLYDALGRRLVKLTEGYRESGTHSVVFDAASMAPGIYLCLLETVELRESHRLVVQ